MCDYLSVLILDCNRIAIGIKQRFDQIAGRFAHYFFWPIGSGRDLATRYRPHHYGDPLLTEICGYPTRPSFRSFPRCVDSSQLRAFNWGKDIRFPFMSSCIPESWGPWRLWNPYPPFLKRDRDTWNAVGYWYLYQTLLTNVTCVRVLKRKERRIMSLLATSYFPWFDDASIRSPYVIPIVV